MDVKELGKDCVKNNIDIKIDEPIKQNIDVKIDEVFTKQDIVEPEINLDNEIELKEISKSKKVHRHTSKEIPKENIKENIKEIPKDIFKKNIKEVQISNAIEESFFSKYKPSKQTIVFLIILIGLFLLFYFYHKKQINDIKKSK